MIALAGVACFGCATEQFGAGIGASGEDGWETASNSTTQQTSVEQTSTTHEDDQDHSNSSSTGASSSSSQENDTSSTDTTSQDSTSSGTNTTSDVMTSTGDTSSETDTSSSSESESTETDTQTTSDDSSTSTDDEDDFGPVVELKLGGFHTCARNQAGQVRCWGANDLGQLGLGSDVAAIGDDELPNAVEIIDVGEPVLQMATGDSHTCFLLGSGRVRCFGHNDQGQLGLGIKTISLGSQAGEVPRKLSDVSVGGAATALSAGDFHTCAILAGGAVKCWGAGEDGRLGLGNTVSIGREQTPASVDPVALDVAALQIVAGGRHSCVIGKDKAVRCWGSNASGALGLLGIESVGANDEFKGFPAVKFATPVNQISAGYKHTCAQLGLSKMVCFGSGEDGATGLGTTADIGFETDVTQYQPLVFGGMLDFPTRMGGHFSCIRVSRAMQAEVRCWGRKELLGSQATENLGDNELATVGMPVSLPAQPIAVELGFAHACAILENGKVACWGSNQFGQLGYGHKETIGDDELVSSAGAVSL